MNEVEMGLKKEAVDSTTNKKIYVEDTTNYTSYQVNGKEIAGGWNINEYYATHDSESVASDNTGYIVGGEKVFVRIQPFVSSSSLQRSFGKTPKDTSLSWNEKTQILTKTGSGNFQVISDSKNSTTTLTIHPTLSDSSVGASDVIKSSALARYDDIRDDFDNLIGAKDYIYGMRFNYMGGSGTGPVGGARIKIDGKEYRLYCNDRGNHLHGGKIGFNAKIWNAEISGETLCLTYFSPDGEENYPGDLGVRVVYSLQNGALTISYLAVPDKKTAINLTNHAYFNLNGEGNNVTAADNFLQINAPYITPTDDTLIPRGELRATAGTPFDFSAPKRISRDIDADDPDLKKGGGYDHCFVLIPGRDVTKPYAVAYSEKAGIEMRCYKDIPAVER